MQQIFYDDAPYVVLFRPTRCRPTTTTGSPGFTAVPDPGGPVMVANDFLNYTNVKPAGGGGGSGASTVVLIVIGVVIALGIIIALVMMMGRRRSADLRD